MTSFPELRHFEYSEFDSPDAPGSGKKMDNDFVRLIDEIRHRYGEPLVVNSGYRTEQHNKVVGGEKNSAHTKGLAVDIQVEQSRKRYKLIGLAYSFGIERIGLSENFVHLDCDETKDPEVFWTYS